MGQKNSKHVPGKQRKSNCCILALKSTIKAGLRIKRNKLRKSSALELVKIFPNHNDRNECLPESTPKSSNGDSCKSSKHFLLTYAISRLAFFAKAASRSKLKSKVELTEENKSETEQFKFNKFPKPSFPQKDEAGSDSNENEMDENGNLVVRDELIKRILSSSKSDTKDKTEDELYKENLDKFEKILSLTASVCGSDDNLSDCYDENNNYVGKRKVKRSLNSKLSRVITTSKNKIEVDAYFADWVHKKANKNGKTSEEQLPKGKHKKNDRVVYFARDKNNNAAGGDKKTKRGVFRRKGSPRSRSRGKGIRKNSNSRSTSRDRKLQEAKRGSCGGKKMCAPRAPPAYLDYGNTSGVGGSGRCRNKRDAVMERLKNVDVVEELTYMVANPCESGGCEDDCDDCDYYAVCESCGEMEPISNNLRKKIKGGCEAKCETTPVTYSRRQRFNFKNRDDDDDGPPYPYEGNQCPSCRCVCCIAGLRRNPNCTCKCCLRMNVRRCNSFDEIPVGKNPQIRRIPCPEEECDEAEKEYYKMTPEKSGMYKYCKENGKFERQVPRTPSPVTLEVPKNNPLTQHELEEIAELCLCKECEPCEPLYLPPMMGQCNQYPPCCAPDPSKTCS